MRYNSCLLENHILRRRARWRSGQILAFQAGRRGFASVSGWIVFQTSSRILGPLSLNGYVASLAREINYGLGVVPATLP